MSPSVAVVVLGDFERSPRMKYHSLSLTKSNCKVDIVAYFGKYRHKNIVNKL